MRFEWDDAKDLLSQEKHGISFGEARWLFESDVDYLEIFHSEHSDSEDRFIAIGPIERRIVVIVYTERDKTSFESLAPVGPTHARGRFTARTWIRADDRYPRTHRRAAEAGDSRPFRRRLIQGRFESGQDIAALRTFVGLTQTDFAKAMGISVHTLRNWEQGRRQPEGPAIALLRIAARHPRIIRESLEAAA